MYICIYKYIEIFGTPEQYLNEEKYMNEKLIERKLTRLARQRGGLAIKFTSPGFDGVPDRLLLFPNGKCAFVELKAPGRKPRPLQIKRIKQIESLGFKVFIIDCPGQIGGIIDELIKS